MTRAGKRVARRKGLVFDQARKKVIKTYQVAPAVGPDNHVVRVDDRLLCAGQIPLT